jgi:choline-sulfatase
MAPFEGSIRVPLIVHAPARFGAARIARPVSLLDLAPTLVELAQGTRLDGLDGVSLAAALSTGVVPERDLPLEYLAEGVRAPQVTLVRGELKLVRGLGEPDLVYDVARDPWERDDLTRDPDRRDEVDALAAAVDDRWDLVSLDEEVRTSQERRRLVVRSLATGELTRWDLGTADGPYIRTGDDFWETLERARRV